MTGRESPGPRTPTTTLQKGWASRQLDRRPQCWDRLHCAGWTIGAPAFRATDGRLAWLAIGYNGENQVRADDATTAEAWLRAVEQARLLGMLRTEGL
jgi:hypothetical protein